MSREGQYFGAHWGSHKPRVGKTPEERRIFLRLAKRRRRAEGLKAIREAMDRAILAETEPATDDPTHIPRRGAQRQMS